MAVSVSKAGPYFSSGQIKFSDLRKYFRSQVRKASSGGSETFSPDPATDTTSISASELLRNTDSSETNPTVPDSNENRTCGVLEDGISSDNNLKLSQFRNSIKYYYVTLPSDDTVTNFDIDAQSWNENMDKTINKFMFIDGTCGSETSDEAAASLDAESYNLTIDITGNLYGSAGAGGAINGGNGGNGGNALSITSTGNSVSVVLRSSGKLYGGGGGGGGGNKGAQGGNGTCYNWEYKTEGSGCEWCGSCGSGWEKYGGCEGDSGCACFIWCRKTQLKDAKCRRKNHYSKSGGAGGNGGVGGTGRGYNNLEGSITGVDGVGGSSGNCNGYNGTITTPGTGQTGKTGANGGDWGAPGFDNLNTGNLGNAGLALGCTNCTLTGTLSAQTIKGERVFS